MRLFFAAILVATIFSGCKQCFKRTTDDILSSWAPALYPGNNYMSFHELYVIQTPDHHNLYLIRRIPFLFFAPRSSKRFILSVRQTHPFLLDKLCAPADRWEDWEHAVLPVATGTMRKLRTNPVTVPVHLSLHL